MCVCTSFSDTGAGLVCGLKHYRCRKSRECSARNTNVRIKSMRLWSCGIRCIAGHQTECGMVEKYVITQLGLHTSSHIVSNACPSPQYIASVVPSSGRLSTRHSGSCDNFFYPWRGSGVAASHLIPPSFLCIIPTSSLIIVVVFYIISNKRGGHERW